MVWNSNTPLGNTSVKSNRTRFTGNFTYISTTMGDSIVGTNTVTTRDHFWNVGSNEDGRHRFIQSPAFTVGATATNPVIGTGMDGVFYLKTVKNRAEWFHRNAAGIFQVTPGYKTGTVSAITSSYVTVDSVPINVYGEIFMYATVTGTASQERFRTITGFFRSNGTTVNSWALANSVEGTSSYANGLKFGNGADASGLNIRVRLGDATSGLDWTYIITYRAL